MTRKGFTLIELLVVVAVIALLIAILMPSLAAAREAAKGAVCLSNTRSVGLGMAGYQAANKGYFPSSYYYINGANSSNGYVHWSGLLIKGGFMDAEEAFVCPSHAVGGWAPTCFTSTRIPEPPGGQTAKYDLDDVQVPRLTYVCNEILTPRKKYASVPQKLVMIDEVEGTADTILVAEYSDVINALLDSSPTGGDAIKTHRPTNAIKVGASGVFDGESYAMGSDIRRLSLSEAETAIQDAQETNAMGKHHIAYIAPAQHKDRSNYTFADGHAESFTLGETLAEDNYKWGKKAYMCPDIPTIRMPNGNDVDDYYRQ